MDNDAQGNPMLMKMEPAPVVKKEGFIFVYLTNESDSEIYFDDFEVTVKESAVVQNTDYYPFGLQHSTSWTRPTDLKNNFLYNAGSELNEMTQNYETFYRNYDPAIGRFNGVDIMATSHHSESPYSFAGNDPVYYNDPMGDTYNPGYYNPGHYRIDWLHENGVATSFYNREGSSSNSPSGGAKWDIPEFGMSAESFIKRAPHSENGGSWNNGSYTFFTANEAREVASNYYFEKYSYLDYSTEQNINGSVGTGATVVIGLRLSERAQNGGTDPCPNCLKEHSDFDPNEYLNPEAFKPKGDIGLLGYVGPGGAAKAVKGIQAGSKWAAKMLKKYPNANLGLKQLGDYWKYSVNVPGKNGYTVYTKYINSQGKTVKWFHDTYSKTGKFLHRGWTEGSTKVHQWWDGFIQNIGPYIPR